MVAAFRAGAVPTARTLGFVVDSVVRPATEYAIEGTPCAMVLGGRSVVVETDFHARCPAASPLAALRAQSFVAAPMLDVHGGVLGFVGIATRMPIADPTELVPLLEMFALRAGVELERQRAEVRFAGVFEFAPDGVLIVDEAGRILQASRMAEEILGYSRKELLELHAEDLVPEEHRAGHVALRRRFQEHPSPRRMGSTRSRLWARRKAGDRIPVEISLSPFETDDERLVVVAIRHVSERVRMEELRDALEARLRESQKMEALGTLAGGIAHDFNNLLAAIVGNAEMVLADKSPASIDDGLHEILRTSSRAAALVRQILTFNRSQPSVRVVTQVVDIVREAVQLLRATIPAGIEFVQRYADDVPPVSVDPNQIHQVLMNLGTNAWHAITRPTGTIDFCVDSFEVADVDFSPTSDVPRGRYTRIRVTDDGTGIDPTVVGRIFDPFFTTKPVGKGSGLGLAVVHGIIKAHGGHIAVESRVGRGSTFTVYLPAAQTTTHEPRDDVRPQERGTGRVLLVDDEVALVRVGEKLLKRLGYEATGVVRAIDAIALLRADPTRFDVVITDQNMPDISGLDLARAIAAIRPDLPVVLATGNETGTQAEFAEANVHSTLHKPFTPTTLSATLAPALERKP